MTGDLRRLLTEYAKAEPRRALGGLYALAGFDFQLRVYVAKLAEDLAGGDDISGAGAVFIEALSDLAKTDSQGLVCIQVKRTLTPAALKSAADEALAIDRFLSTQDVRGLRARSGGGQSAAGGAVPGSVLRSPHQPDWRTPGRGGRRGSRGTLCRGVVRRSADARPR